jgi:predicted NBD/HSP70 family sugar kinase
MAESETERHSTSQLLDGRSQNERAILKLIRQERALPKAEIAKRSGLSAQSATVIINKLESDGLVTRLPAIRGGVGQPKVPFGLAAKGAYGVGLKIGRRSYDMSLIDLSGAVHATLHENIAYPTVSSLLTFSKRAYTLLSQQIKDVSRIRGLGVAMPFEIWNWAEEAGASPEALNTWRNVDIQHELQHQLQLPVFLSNDATAACSAEMAFGNSPRLTNYLYIFVGTFLGGGLVLNGHLFTGKSGNAGAIGSLPFTMQSTSNSANQLISQSSLYLLEKALNKAGLNGNRIYDDSEYWPTYGKVLTQWIDNAATGLAYAAQCAFTLLDLDGVIIDGAMPSDVKQQLLTKTQHVLMQSDLRGVSVGELVLGKVGSKAQSIGSANLPLIANYY